MIRPIRKLILAGALLAASVLLTPRAQATGNCCGNCYTGWQFCNTECNDDYPDPTACLDACYARYQSCANNCPIWHEECFIW
jgi:hypothetical protein